MGTLSDLVHANSVRAERGQDGMGKDMYGRGGKDTVVRVPLGHGRHEGRRIYPLACLSGNVLRARVSRCTLLARALRSR